MKNLRNDLLRRVLARKRATKEENVRKLRERGETIESFTLREAVPDDLAKLARLHVQAWAETYPMVKKPPTFQIREHQWREQFNVKDGSWFCFVVEDPRGELVGFIKGKTYASTDLPGYGGEINKIYLLSEYQRLGLGRRMVGHVVRRFLTMGITSMVLFGEPSNPSIAFHEAIGGMRLLDKDGVFNGGYGWNDLSKVAELCPED
jgi:ribosomal protein S18 acetylase RimI-like enzyme